MQFAFQKKKIDSNKLWLSTHIKFHCVLPSERARKQRREYYSSYFVQKKKTKNTPLF